MLRNLLPSWLNAAETTSSTPEGTGSNPELGRSAAVRKTDSPVATETDDPNTTPKATASQPSLEVPALTFDNESSSATVNSQNDFQMNARSGAIRDTLPETAVSRGPPTQSGSNLMPPPSRPRVTVTNSLRVPTTGPLPNRGPPVSSQQRISAGLSPTTASKASNTRGKVLLEPGHSPMDWAALTRKGNLGGVTTFERVTPSKLRSMTGRKGKPAWSSWGGKVYNLTPYLPFHPGGESELMKAAGRDGTKLFMEVHPWVNWESMLNACLVGVLVPEEFSENESSLEAMD